MRKILLCVLSFGTLMAASARAQQPDTEQQLRAELAKMKELVARVEALLAGIEAARTPSPTGSPPAATQPQPKPMVAAEMVRQQAPGMNTPPMMPVSRPEGFRKAPPRIDVLLQVRGDFPEDTSRTSTFFLRKAEVGLKGHLFGGVDFSLEIDPVRPSDPLRRTYIRLTRFDKLHVKLGLEKAPIGLEELTSTARIPFVDRSEVTDRFAAAEELGVHLESHWEKWLFQFAVTNGGRRLLRDDNRQKDVTGRIVFSPHKKVTFGLAALSGENGPTRTARDRYNTEFRWGNHLTGLQSEFYRARDASIHSSAFYVAGYWAIPTRWGMVTHIQPVARYEFIGRSDRDLQQERRLVTFGASFLLTEQKAKFQINYLKDVCNPARRDELRALYQIEF